jgi:hypothetical protein
MTMLEFFSMCMQKDVRLEALWPGLDLAAVKLYVPVMKTPGFYSGTRTQTHMNSIFCSASFSMTKTTERAVAGSGLCLTSYCAFCFSPNAFAIPPCGIGTSLAVPSHRALEQRSNESGLTSVRPLQPSTNVCIISDYFNQYKKAKWYSGVCYILRC